MPSAIEWCRAPLGFVPLPVGKASVTVCCLALLGTVECHCGVSLWSVTVLYPVPLSCVY